MCIIQSNRASFVSVNVLRNEISIRNIISAAASSCSDDNNSDPSTFPPTSREWRVHRCLSGYVPGTRFHAPDCKKVSRCTWATRHAFVKRALVLALGFWGSG
eukprot:PhF_6_TR19913/c0_g1_i1/m.28958